MANLVLEPPKDFLVFPYDSPYDIQRDLMRHLFSAIEEKKLAIVESPTGTGKTLSLLSGALTWLNDEKQRSEKGKFMEMEESYSNDSAPQWIIKQSIDFARRRLLMEQEDFQARLDKARQKEEALRRMMNARVTKRRKLDYDMSDASDEEEDRFLPEDEEDSNLSPEVKELMRRLELSKRKDESREVEEPTCTKIYYASRTHSQLSQLQVELEKLKHLEGQPVERPIARVVPLGSRKNLCINDELRGKGGDLDEGCRELMNEKGKKKCPYLPSPEEDILMQDLRDSILATPRDIEDLALLGREMKTCPYYGSRRAIKQAELVALPYNLLLQKQARESLGVDVKDQVVIIDEAHNLIDTILSIHSVSLPHTTLKKSLQQLRVYLQRFKKLLTPQHSLHLRRLVEFLVSLDKYCDTFASTTTIDSSTLSREIALTTGDLVSALGSKVQGINLLEIEAYLRSSKIARKISGYCDKVAEKEAKNSGNTMRRSSTNPPLHTVQNFILTLVNADEDGKVFLSFSRGMKDAEPSVTLRYQLLNPSGVFKELVEEARSVVLAGGTMAPISDFHIQLLPYITPQQISTFSCGHVMPTQNLKAIVVSKGPTGKSLCYKLKEQRDPTIIADLGQILFNIVSIVPDGLVVFLPSYSFLNTLRTKWKESGLLDKLGSKKMVLFESQESTSVESVLKEYASAIRSKPPNSKLTGALLFAVVGAKLSEGLNFSDDLARGVVVVGLPFANLASVELKERMDFVRALDKKPSAGAPFESRSGKKMAEDGIRSKNDGEGHSIATMTQNEGMAAISKGMSGSRDAGMELYENLCMKSVNQSIGRAIRHRNDWAALVLLDERYTTSRIKDKLPKWIGECICTPANFGGVVKELAGFYRERRDG